MPAEKSLASRFPADGSIFPDRFAPDLFLSLIRGAGQLLRPPDQFFFREEGRHFFIVSSRGRMVQRERLG